MATRRNRFLLSGRFLTFCYLTVGISLTFGAGFATLNFAIVCMAKTEAINASTSHASGACPHNNSEHYNPEFVWKEYEFSSAQSAYLWGAPWFPLFFGYVIQGISLRWALFGMGLITSLGTLLTPVATRHGGVWALFAVRFILGFFGSTLAPVVNGICSKWCTKDEVALVYGMLSNGLFIGQLLCMFSSGSICDWSDRGWENIFYIYGAMIAIFYLSFPFFFVDYPENSRWISRSEQEYIVQRRVVRKQREASHKVPWIKMLTSLTVWAATLSFVANRFAMYYIVIEAPLYVRDVLGVDAVKNGVFSALPILAQMVGRYVTGFLMVKAKMINATLRTKLFNTAGFLSGAVFLLALTAVKCGQVGMAVTFLVLQSFFTSLRNGGSVTAVILFSGQFAPEVSAFTSTLAYIVAIALPYIVKIMTREGTPQEWWNTFYLNAAVCVAGALVWLFFGHAELLTWAKPRESKTEDGDAHVDHGRNKKQKAATDSQNEAFTRF